MEPVYYRIPHKGGTNTQKKTMSFLKKISLFFRHLFVENHKLKCQSSYAYRLNAEKEDEKYSTLRITIKDLKTNVTYKHKISDIPFLRNMKICFIGNYFFISYRRGKIRELMIFNTEKNLFSPLLSCVRKIMILDEEYIFLENESGYHVFNAITGSLQKMKKFVGFDKNDIIMEKDFGAFLCSTIVLMELSEETNVEFHPLRYGPFQQDKINLVFGDGIVTTDSRYLSKLHSDFIDEQLDNENEIHFPIFSCNDFYKSNLMFAHFINSKSLFLWLPILQEYILK